MSQSGYGGQAKEMRGEVNVVGIPTKWRPGRKEADYFTDNDANHPVVIAALDHAFGVVQAALRQGITVVLPQAGIGTGLAELPTRAPRIYKLIQDKLKELERDN